MRLRADGSKDAQTSSDEGREAEVEEEEEESDDEFCDRTTAPVPQREVLAVSPPRVALRGFFKVK